jgi:heme/copper-type cytochrome/quinol oxidase subunit 2
MNAFAVWHLLVLALLIVVPLTVVAVVVLIAVRLRRTRRTTSEERIAQRTAELLRSEGRREG